VRFVVDLFEEILSVGGFSLHVFHYGRLLEGLVSRLRGGCREVIQIACREVHFFNVIYLHVQGFSILVQLLAVLFISLLLSYDLLLKVCLSGHRHRVQQVALLL